MVDVSVQPLGGTPLQESVPARAATDEDLNSCFSLFSPGSHEMLVVHDGGGVLDDKAAADQEKAEMQEQGGQLEPDDEAAGRIYESLDSTRNSCHPSAFPHGSPVAADDSLPSCDVLFSPRSQAPGGHGPRASREAVEAVIVGDDTETESVCRVKSGDCFRGSSPLRLKPLAGPRNSVLNWFLQNIRILMSHQFLTKGPVRKRKGGKKEEGDKEQRRGMPEEMGRGAITLGDVQPGTKKTLRVWRSLQMKIGAARVLRRRMKPWLKNDR